MASVHPLDLERHLELERRLDQQEAALARLLAHFPARVDSIAEDRLHQILQDLIDHATTLFPGRVITGAAVPETDRETSACHRLTVHIAVGPEFDPVEFAERAFEVQRYAARHLSREEHRAISLGIEPHFPETGGGRES
jgi:hypothetical protein